MSKRDIVYGEFGPLIFQRAVTQGVLEARLLHESGDYTVEDAVTHSPLLFALIQLDEYASKRPSLALLFAQFLRKMDLDPLIQLARNEAANKAMENIIKELSCRVVTNIATRYVVTVV